MRITSGAFFGIVWVLASINSPALAAFTCPPVSPWSPAVTSPPRGTPLFYSKYIDADGIPILGSSRVCDRSLQAAYEIALHMVSARPDYLKTMSDRKVRISIFAVSEKMTDLPEDRDLTGVWIDPAHTRKYDDTCGGGAVRGRPTSICEKNLIGVEDPYFGRMSVLIHEFGHTIQNIGMDQTTFNEVLTAYSNAQDQKLFTRKDGVTVSYMMSNSMEFFAEGTGTWFNAADPTNPANSPEQQGRDSMKSYDFELYQILQRIYPDDDWVYPKK